MVQSRDTALSKAAQRSIAQLLKTGKESSARIRVENIIRSDMTTELHEILELYCELLIARAGLLDSPVCDPGLEEAVKSLMYAAPKTEIKELQQVRALLGERYGKDFVLAAMDNKDHKVSAKVVEKLSVTPPKEELVICYLEEIAKTYRVDWPRRAPEELGAPPSLLDDGDDGDDDNPSGGQAQKNREVPLVAEDSKETAAREELSKATPPRTIGPTTPLQITPPSPSTDNIHPKVTLNRMELKPNKKMSDAAEAPRKTAPKKADIRDGIPDVDELAKRFAALKR